LALAAIWYTHHFTHTAGVQLVIYLKAAGEDCSDAYQAFFDSNGLMPRMRSAYRQFHSTETAVTKVFSNLLVAADNGQMSALCLLDLTAAFDTVDHDLLLL